MTQDRRRGHQPGWEARGRGGGCWSQGTKAKLRQGVLLSQELGRGMKSREMGDPRSSTPPPPPTTCLPPSACLQGGRPSAAPPPAKAVPGSVFPQGDKKQLIASRLHGPDFQDSQESTKRNRWHLALPPSPPWARPGLSPPLPCAPAGLVILHEGAAPPVKNQNPSPFRSKTCAHLLVASHLFIHLQSQHVARALYNSSKRPHIMSSALTPQRGPSAPFLRAPHAG